MEQLAEDSALCAGGCLFPCALENVTVDSLLTVFGENSMLEWTEVIVYKISKIVWMTYLSLSFRSQNLDNCLVR